MLPCCITSMLTRCITTSHHIITCHINPPPALLVRSTYTRAEGGREGGGARVTTRHTKSASSTPLSCRAPAMRAKSVPCACACACAHMHSISALLANLSKHHGNTDCKNKKILKVNNFFILFSVFLLVFSKIDPTLRLCMHMHTGTCA